MRSLAEVRLCTSLPDHGNSYSLHCRTPQVCSTMATSAVAQVAPLLRCNSAVGLNRRPAAGHSTRQPPHLALVAVPRNCAPLARRTALSATSRRCVPVVRSSASVAASPDQVRGCPAASIRPCVRLDYDTLTRMRLCTGAR
jgi:hypothetical protein